MRKQMLKKYIFDCVTFLLKNTCWLPTATCYQVLSSGSRLGNYATVHEFYSEMVLESINNDGREEKKQKKSRNRSATEKLSQWGFNWEVLRLAYPFWVGVKKPGLIHLCQSIIECGRLWERGRTLDEMAFSSWGKLQIRLRTFCWQHS